MVGGIVATSIVSFRPLRFSLFMHGKDISIPKGTEITAYINGDVKMDIAKFQPVQPGNASGQNVAASSSATSAGLMSAKLQLESTPPGADIEIDGSFVGNTPSEVQVTEGDRHHCCNDEGIHRLETNDENKFGSNVHLAAELEKAAVPQQ